VRRCREGLLPAGPGRVSSDFPEKPRKAGRLGGTAGRSSRLWAEEITVRRKEKGDHNRLKRRGRRVLVYVFV